MKPYRLLAVVLIAFMAVAVVAQRAVPVGGGSYASIVPLSKSYTSEHGGCQAYQMEHRRLYLPDSLLARLGSPDGSRQGTLALPSNDWWTYALVNDWTGKIWFYPGWAEANSDGLSIGYPTYWEPTGCEVKWDTPLLVTFTNTSTGKKAAFKEALVDAWSDFSMSFIMQDGEAWVRVTCMHGSPLVWLESQGISMQAANPDAAKYAVFSRDGLMTIAMLTEGLGQETVAPYAFRIPRTTRMDYAYNAQSSSLTTTFRVWTQAITNNQSPDGVPVERENPRRKGQQSPITNNQSPITNEHPVLIGFLPHHYYGTTFNFQLSTLNYLSPRGELRLAEGNNFAFTYPVHPYLPYFPAPMEWGEEFSAARMAELNADYAKRGTFGGDTYWGGKGLTQMAHYMTFALQMGDTATFRMAKQRLREILIDWYTYTPGEERFYFARYPRWGALVGMDPSYDSDTFNDHHFHYGYFVYASAILCLLDDDFRTQYGPMAREVARDYANWERPLTNNHSPITNPLPWFRTLDPYCGHSFAGGMGNGGNGNGQESTSESIQGWGGVYLLGAALQDPEMLEAGIMGYTLETRATAEYWFDRQRRNIDYTKYHHPYCCNLTMQGVGWWTWFSGDPVWMHSIQWLPISPILTNHFCEDMAFTRWDYTQMYASKEVGNYEAEKNGLGDESGLGNVCLSYLSLFDADSAIRVWDRMDRMGKALAKNPDTGGITYWLAHSHKALGEKRYDIFADHPLACVYTDTLSGRTTYAVYNVSSSPLSVRFFGAKDTTLTVPQGLTLVSGHRMRTTTTIPDETVEVIPDPLAWDLPYPNLALHKPVTASSEENAGCLKENLTDGDPATRWGSAHKDNEYVIVDLKEQCYIDHLILRWETAYASEYELALSNDLSAWRTVTLASAGGVETVHLTQLLTTDDTPKKTDTRARYIRLTGLQRATQYGTSLYELEAYGRPLSGDPSQVFAISISASDTVICQGESTTLTVTAFNYNGEVLSTQSESKTYPEYGIFTETRTVGSCSASLDIIVLETEKATSASVSPKEVTMPLGTEQTFVVSILNQFGDVLDTCDSTYRATAVGDFRLVFTCHGMTDTATVHVQTFDEVNLALHKTATASGTEDEPSKGARYVVDGDLNTRWGSRFRDDEWVAVDLGECYLLTTVKLYWEAAYATSFDIQLSDDGEDYRLAKAVTGSTGGVQTLDIRQDGEPVPAQFVRIFCHTRNTGYGSSLWEIEVYGTSLCEPIDTSIENPLTNHQSPITIKIIRDGHLFIIHNGVRYDITGQRR